MKNLASEFIQKKAFSKKGLFCVFCRKDGHDHSFCPLRRTQPEKADLSPWVESIIKEPAPTTPSSTADWQSLGSRLNQGNPWAHSISILDRLRSRLGFWKALGANHCVLSWLAYGLPLRFSSEPPRWIFENHTSFNEHASFASTEIAGHIEDGRFFKPSERQVAHISPQQVELNKKGKMRRCDDLRNINAYLAHVNVKLEGHSNVPDIVAPNDMTFTEDLTKAYYMLRMEPSAHKWLCFRDPKLGTISSRTLLFGLSPAVMWFTKICRPVLSFMRSLGLKVVNMIDDWLGAADALSVNEVHASVRLILTELGWLLNTKGAKPSSSTLFLGLIIDSLKMEFQVPMDKILRCKALLSTIHELASQGRPVRTIDLQRLTGHTISNILAIPALRVWTRALYREIAIAAEHGHSLVVLNPDSRMELLEIARLLDTQNGAPLGIIAQPTDAAHVDASECGFGGRIGETPLYGPLPNHLIGTSSTLRELGSVELLLMKAEATNVPLPKRLLLCMDSYAAVRNLEKGGGPMHDLCVMVKRIMVLCERLGISLFPLWIPREKNTEADALSKKVAKIWQLRPNIQSILSADAGCEIVLPPYNTIRNCISRAVARGKIAAFIIPKWKAQSWWHFLEQNFTLTNLAKTCFVPIDEIGAPPWDMVLASYPPIKPTLVHLN